jgi:hypothetical protein
VGCDDMCSEMFSDVFLLAYYLLDSVLGPTIKWVGAVFFSETSPNACQSLQPCTAEDSSARAFRNA